VEAPHGRVFGAARIVALALIALSAIGLAYLHFSTAEDAVSVPSGSRAGQLDLHSCTYATERGSYRADCGTLVVPENRHDTRSRLIALPVTRIRARATKSDAPIFRLQGGPGITNMEFPDASRFAGKHDVVLVGYRGVDGSTKLDCPEVSSSRAHARDFLTEQAFRADANAFEACAARLRSDGVDLAGYTLVQRVDDLDAARRALGYDRIDLLSESAGTRTALIYSWRYPKRVHRSVLIGVNPPGAFLWDAKTTGEQVGRYAALCERDASCRDRTRDLSASLHSAYRNIPDHWWFLPIKQGNVRAAAFFGLMNATTDGGGPLAAPMTIDTLLAADRGDGSGAWLLSVMAQLVFPHGQVWGDVAAFGRSDAAYGRRFYAAHRNRGSVIGAPGTDLIWADGRLLDAWPASPDENAYTRVPRSNVETLLVGGSLDFATPPQNATRALLPQLPRGRQVVLRNLGHTDDFWAYEPKASTRLVTRFLETGRVDTSLYPQSRVDFTPTVSQGTIAKIVLAAILGFGALTTLSLLALALRVRRRGAVGRKASALVRSLYAPLLGFGGWLAGALVALVSLPTVPVDDELLVALATGVPVGLAIYLAWVHGDWSARTKGTGLAASLGGALLGAWLGFNAAAIPLGILTALLGATAGANLVLVLLDIAWARQASPTRVGGEIVTRYELESDPAPTSPSALAHSVVSVVNEGGTEMPANTHHSNLAARMGRWSASHWKTATFGWLAFVLVAFGLGGMVGAKSVDPNDAGPGQSGRMDKILEAGFKQPAAESVLIQSRSLRATDPAFKAAIGDITTRVAKIAVVKNVHTARISKDGRAALVEFDIRGAKDKAIDKIDPVLASVAAAQRAHPGFVIGEFGDASAQKGVDTAFADDLGKAGTLSLPITLGILVLTFGALVAAGIPLLLALTAVIATFGLVALPSNLVPVAMEAPAMVLLIGLAVGVDYSMFYLKRERQERAAGRSQQDALEIAAATSGRSVLISGLTVIVSMAGMFFTGDSTFASLALATILVVAVAVLGSLTVLPALLSKLGDGVDRGRIPFVSRLRRDDGEGRFWGAIVDRVLRRPALSAAAAAALLLALAAPALQLHLAPQGPESFPQSLAVIKSYKQMQQAFPGKALPANVVVKAPSVRTPAMHRAVAQLERRALASGRAFEPITVDVNKAGTVANITIPIAGNGTDSASNAAFRKLRKTIVPATVGAVPGTEAGVTGQTAKWKDSADELRSNLLPVVGFVLLFAFALMLVAFRSVVIAAKAIALNLLSVAAAYGVMVLVFQHGIGKGLLGASSADGIEVVVPLLLFVILFGLSMDYHVFIISRIRELFDRGEEMDDAVSHGIKSTAGVVTSAAIVMVFVFAIFATLSMPFFKQFGVGLAAAILIDATIVRAVLLPATMKLLGKWNWYLPRWLEWLPHLEPETESGKPERPAVPASA
jgi:putative drug exporter of the RND superfamily